MPLRLSPCLNPNQIKIFYDFDTSSDPIYQTIDRHGIQGDRSVTFTIAPHRSSNSLVDKLMLDRMFATVVIKDKPNNEASGSSIITGEPMVGQTLTVDTSGISDADGLNNAVFTYRWYGTYALKTKDLSAQSTYTVQESDIRRQIQLVVSFTDDVGYKERISSTPTDAVVPDVRYYFLRTEKSIEEPQSGQREVGTWVYLNDWPRVRSADGTKVHFWGVEPVVPFNIPYTVSYEEGAQASWFEIADVTFSATAYTNKFYLQGRSTSLQEKAVERSAATSATWSPGLSIARRQFSSCLTSSVPSTMDSLSMRYGTSEASSACSKASKFVRSRRQMSR